MAEITWIKLKTDMFDSTKIRLIEKLPEGDTILVIWIKLLTAAGKANCKGYIMLTENIPMNIEEMATIFDRPLNTVRLAMEAFKRYGMVEVDENDVVCISNWEKHQNIDGMDKIREQNRLRKQKEREKKKTILISNPNECHVTVTDNHATELELELEEEKKDIKPSCPKFTFDDMENAKLLFQLMQDNNPGVKEPNLDKWASDFRLIRERDKRTDEQIKYLIDWTQNDNFWKSNILSPSKLRKQWDSLVIKIKSNNDRAKVNNLAITTQEDNQRWDNW